MKITILNSSETHPINTWLSKWLGNNSSEHDINLVREKSELKGGDLLFLISCTEIISQEQRNKYTKTLVIHASDLPKGRGWSPHVWEIINGAEYLTLSLLEATDKVDAGDIWHKFKVQIPSTALYDEINQMIFQTELSLMDFAVAEFGEIEPLAQDLEIQSTYWPKRSPEDSELDISKSIEDQFNLLRVCDPVRFPSYFYKDGQKYIIKIEAISE